jgi:hypothetical protein
MREIGRRTGGGIRLLGGNVKRCSSISLSTYSSIDTILRKKSAITYWERPIATDSCL